ncbi:MAG: type I-C CRISPR-associated protein Cas8c/Csd1 [Thermomicrobiales bacterium]|nr:type I-C CRISPR-associated protein Cas8c/Csd1 [Thermomicrobiales bacterium]
MFLQQLVDYADRELSLPPPMYQWQPIRYVIELDATGQYLGFSDSRDPGDKSTDRGVPRLAPHVKRSSGIRPKLLADTGEYALGAAAEESKPERVASQHAAFLAQLESAREMLDDNDIEAVITFLKSPRKESLVQEGGLDPKAQLTFVVDGRWLIDKPTVQRAWQVLSGERASGGPEMTCIICGVDQPVLDRHPLKIKGIREGQSAGTDLISANAPAFESYGLKNSLIAPTCQSCAEKYGNALNALLASPRTHLHSAGVEYIFWTRSASAGFNPAALLSDPSPEEVRNLYEAPDKARTATTNIDSDRFYAAALGASGSRAALLSWIDASVEEVRQSLIDWFAMQSFVDSNGDPGKALGAWQIAGATVRDPRKEKPVPAISAALLQTAFTGVPLPQQLLDLCVRRNRAEQGVKRQRAVAIKLVLCSRQPSAREEWKAMSELSPTNFDPAYLCGRLLAVLESIQKRALNNPNATIVDRYYGSASSAPASVFGTLLHGAQPHLSKMAKNERSRGASIALNRRLEDVLEHLHEFPVTLTLQEQGLFALGYYHQRAEDRRGARERGEAAAETEETLPDETPDA